MVMLRIVLLAAAALVAGIATAEDIPPRYNYRLSEEFAALSNGDRDRVDQVNRDLTLLWGALDLYAEEHAGKVPKCLDDLVPGYLDKLPRDPFATDETASRKETWYQKSLDGRGYQYHPGTGRAFVLRSAGLPAFPYRGRSGNGGLVQSRGYWRDGRQMLLEVF
jgi:hypothetical protein